MMRSSQISNDDFLTLFEKRLGKGLNTSHKYYKLSHAYPWQEVEETFAPLYSDTGRPAKSIRLMVSLLLLKSLENLSDERVVEMWAENPYWQYFSGAESFQWREPCEASELTHFRQRIGEKGVEKLFEISVRMTNVEAKNISIDTTAQEKNITYPTDGKLRKKIIDNLNKIAKKEKINQRQTYEKDTKRFFLLSQRGKNTKKGKEKKGEALKKLKGIAGRLLRELEKKIKENRLKIDKNRLKYYEELFRLYWRVLSQELTDKGKVYSLHESQVACIAKGKAFPKYEFGSKVSFAVDQGTNVVVGIMSFRDNLYDGHTLKSQLDQVEKILGKKSQRAVVDKGYGPEEEVNGVKIVSSKRFKKDMTKYERKKIKGFLRKRAGIEPIISHVKHDHRMAINYLKGETGDKVNCMLAAIGFNTKKAIELIFNFFKNGGEKWSFDIALRLKYFYISLWCLIFF